jgi:CDGSH-type Zn-finger protein
MSSDDKKTGPSITPTPNGPYLVSGLGNLSNSKGEPIEAREKYGLCRCGGSANKPFCDGTHAKNGFTSDKAEGRVADLRENHEGNGITIHDNRGTCAHAGVCTDNLKTVFKLKQEPWIDPKGAKAEEIAKVISGCPSGALSYSVGGKESRDHEGAPAIQVTKNGPYRVTGHPDLQNTERGEGASHEHFTLCRCGGSKNKPFCDGTHWYNDFSDDKN